MAPLFKLCLLFLAFSLAAMDCNCTSVKREISGVQEAPKDIQTRPSCTMTKWGCYKAFKIRTTWKDAKAHCVSNELELASLHLVRTMEHLLQLGTELKLGKGGSGYWVDLSRSNGVWQWGYGARLENDSPLWRKNPDEPNNGPIDDKGLFAPGLNCGLMDFPGIVPTWYILCADPSKMPGGREAGKKQGRPQGFKTWCGR